MSDLGVIVSHVSHGKAHPPPARGSQADRDDESGVAVWQQPLSLSIMPLLDTQLLKGEEEEGW